MKDLTLKLIVFYALSSVSAYAENWHVSRITLKAYSDTEGEQGDTFLGKYRSSAKGYITIEEEGDDDFNQRTRIISGLAIDFISQGLVKYFRDNTPMFEMTIRNTKGKTIRDLLTTYYGIQHKAGFAMGGGYSLFGTRSGLVITGSHFDTACFGLKMAQVKMRIGQNSPIKIEETLTNKDGAQPVEPVTYPLSESDLDYRLN